MVTRNAANIYITPDTNNQVLMKSQPAFMAYLGTTDTNVTGDGTVFTLGSGNALTEVFDQNNDFATDTFTAPITGKYHLGTSCWISGHGVTQTSASIKIITSNGTYQILQCQPVNLISASNWFMFMNDIFCDMDASDTSTVTITESNGTKEIDITTGRSTNFHGILIC